MESRIALSQDIVAITSLIQDQYPELMKYLDEMPILMQTEPTQEMSKQDFKDYLDSLKKIVEHYSKEPSSMKELQQDLSHLHL